MTGFEWLDEDRAPTRKEVDSMTTSLTTLLYLIAEVDNVNHNDILTLFMNLSFILKAMREGAEKLHISTAEMLKNNPIFLLMYLSMLFS